jgi:hypothetical protein
VCDLDHTNDPATLITQSVRMYMPSALRKLLALCQALRVRFVVHGIRPHLSLASLCSLCTLSCRSTHQALGAYDSSLLVCVCAPRICARRRQQWWLRPRAHAMCTCDLDGCREESLHASFSPRCLRTICTVTGAVNDTRLKYWFTNGAC